MPKPDLDLTNPKGRTGDPKIDPDPVLGRLDMLLIVLERCAVALEDLADIMAGEEEDEEPAPEGPA